MSDFWHIKEIKDFLRDFDRFYSNFKSDSNFDIQNNKKGIEISEKFRYINKKALFDYIFKTEIEPKWEKL